jgi:hypothetical protein
MGIGSSRGDDRAVQAAEIISEAVDPEANIMLGTVIMPRVQDEVKITVIATGLRDAQRLSGREEPRGLGSGTRFGGAPVSPREPLDAARSQPARESESRRERPTQPSPSETWERDRTREPERERRWGREPAPEPRHTPPSETPPAPESERRRDPDRDRPRWRLPLQPDRPRPGQSRDDEDFDVPSFLRRPRR